MANALLDRLQLGLGRRIPVVLQTEASECGLACLAMLLAHHGTVTDLATLRGRHGSMPQGMTVTEWVRVAGVEELSTRALRADLHEMDQLRLPCVLHWDMGHFVVLREIKRDRHGEHFIVLDPALGERRLGAEEFSQRFTGIALEAWPGNSFVPKQEAQRVSIRQMLGRISGVWRTVWRVLAVSLGLEVLGLVAPLFMQWVVDHVVISRDLDLLSTLGAGFLLLLLVQQLMTLARSWLLLRVGTQLKVQWRSNVLAHLLRLPLDFFARRHLGDVMSRFASINNIQRVLTDTFVEAALDGLMVILTLVLMLLYSPTLTVVAVISVLLYVAVRTAWYGPLRRATAEHLVRSALETSHLLESVRGIRAIRLFSRQGERMGAWQSLMVADVNADLHIQKLEIWYRLVRRTLSGSFALLLLWLGARDVIAGQMSVGMLLAFLAYRSQFDSRFTELVNKWFDLRMLGLDAERLADIVLTPAEAHGAGSSQPLPKGAPAIEIKGLTFRYAQGAPDVLNNFRLKIPAGRSVAIAGASGCGKTTLVQLLLGVYTPQAGEILVGGMSLQQLGLDRWRSQIGTVMQDDVLFAGSIADNIAFFDNKPDQAWLERCAVLASVHEDISKLPMAYQTLVGDMGTSLSGGQKQRILLARALYRKPRVLILDEATSHLDVKREAEIGRAIAGMPMTRIVVAHRPQTLASVDHVVEMEGGQVVRIESGRAYAIRMGMAVPPLPPGAATAGGAPGAAGSVTPLPVGKSARGRA